MELAGCKRSSPLDTLRIDRGGGGRRGVGGGVAVALALRLLGLTPVRLLVVDAVVVGRRRGARHRRGLRGRRRWRRRRLQVVGEHGQELVVVEAVEVVRPDAGIAVAGAGLEKSHGVADGAAVRAALGGGEVEELVDPRRLLLLRRRVVERRRRHGRGEERAHGGAALLLLVVVVVVPAPELRPRRRHGGDLGRQLRHGRDPAPRVGSIRGNQRNTRERWVGGATPKPSPRGARGPGRQCSEGDDDARGRGAVPAGDCARGFPFF